MRRKKELNMVPPTAKIRFKSVELFIALLTIAAVCVHSSTQRTQPQAFHICGTIRTATGAVVPGTLVTFHGQGTTKTITANDEGFYDAELPVGLYTMTAQSPSQRQLQKYMRPLFRATLSTRFTLDVILDLAEPNCDPVMSLSGRSITPDQYRSACGGWDFFPLPARENIPFQLFIRYGSRRSDAGSYDFSGRKLPDGKKTPVFVAYNLFTLRSDHLVYDEQHRSLRANGNVAIANADGAIQRVDSMTFKIENGEVSPLPIEPANP